jgi:hypothetical protein
MKTNTSTEKSASDITRTSLLESGSQDTGNFPKITRFGLVLSVATIFFGILAISGVGFAAKGGIPGPPPGGETSNNLSVPAVVTGSVTTVPHNWAPPAEPELGVHYSYGCDLPESDGSFSYPNTSCVNNLSDPNYYYDALECTDEDLPSPCQGLDVYRIYWQKVDANEWWADDEGVLGTTPDEPFRSVAYLDWGDALEAVTPNERSFVRVETQPYTELVAGFDPSDPTLLDLDDPDSPPLGSCVGAALAASLDPEIVCKVGLHMWHVSGQGITEHWGVRAFDTDLENNSYNYDSPFQIIKTTNARLNITKMAPGDAICPEPGGNPGDLPPELGAWDSEIAEWGDTCTIYDEPYSVELSVGGKYVYGYNWRLRYAEMSETACPDWLKTGYWRLTFYAPEDVIFDNELAPNVAPPTIPSELRQLPRDGVFNTAIATEPLPPPEAILLRDGVPVLEDEDPDADDRLYIPVIDTVNNLTYIDICVVAKTGDGGHK